MNDVIIYQSDYWETLQMASKLTVPFNIRSHPQPGQPNFFAILVPESYEHKALEQLGFIHEKVY